MDFRLRDIRRNLAESPGPIDCALATLVAMRNRRSRTIITLLIFVGSCSCALAFFGQVNHDWSLMIPVVDTRVGIFEWQDGTSTMFLGITDFTLPCGAVVAIVLEASCIGIVLLVANGLILPKLNRRS